MNNAIEKYKQSIIEMFDKKASLPEECSASEYTPEIDSKLFINCIRDCFLGEYWHGLDGTESEDQIKTAILFSVLYWNNTEFKLWYNSESSKYEYNRYLNEHMPVIFGEKDD